MSNGTITMATSVGKYDLDVTTFQMAVLFCWENRRFEALTLENLRLATELPETELRKTLWSLVAFPKLKRYKKKIIFNNLGHSLIFWNF